MPILQCFQRAGLGALLIAAVTPASAHIVPLADLEHGIQITQAQCSALPSTVWITALGRTFCIRYYVSTAGGEGTRPAVYLSGDKLGRLNLRTGQYAPTPNAKDINTDDLAKSADGLSRQTKTTAIYLGRPGLDGSSGDHRIRHTVLELQATQAALEAIKQRHRFEGFHLIGQSGGSALVGGLLALRTDIGCAAIGAGSLVHSKPSAPTADPSRDYFNVADAVPVIARRSTARIMLITDPLDKKVPARTQTPFVEMMRQAGKPVEQFIVEATDEDHHFVNGYARLAATECMRGTPNAEIAQSVQQMVAKRVAAAKAKAEPRPGPSAGMPAQPAWTNATASATAPIAQTVSAQPNAAPAIPPRAAAAPATAQPSGPDLTRHVATECHLPAATPR